MRATGSESRHHPRRRGRLLGALALVLALQTTSVEVSGDCYVDGAEDFAELTVTIDPPGTARVGVAGQVVTSDTVIDGLPVGGYPWSAEPVGAATIGGTTEGVVVVEPCLDVAGVQVGTDEDTLPHTGQETLAPTGAILLVAGLGLLALAHAGRRGRHLRR